ncbi:hypothetical protein GGR57DRAFT_267586 [Xylariaceae sp. FL1272]|nr:hypothetical protein GGR57DRAFT_267586 [Xylariaceae sp. FL1272]
MDDPWYWDVDKVVQELCFTSQPWVHAPELPPTHQLEASLREQGADGHTILTYPDDSELCDSLGIKTLKQKNTFKHARSQLRQRSHMYQRYLDDLDQPHAPNDTPISPISRPPAATLLPLSHARSQTPQRRKSDLDNIPSQQPPTRFPGSDRTAPPATKRKNEEDHVQPRAKRPEPAAKSNIQVIELSDDDDDDNDAVAREPDSAESNRESSTDREVDSEFGGQYANRHITEDDWTRVCKFFQCSTATTSLKPPGFDIEIAAYQLHAIWWMLTQRPVRGIQGGCLGDAMGLGKTIEVLSTFATFAMIKANSAFQLVGGHYSDIHNVFVVALLDSTVDVGFQATGAHGSKICNS